MTLCTMVVVKIKGISCGLYRMYHYYSVQEWCIAINHAVQWFIQINHSTSQLNYGLRCGVWHIHARVI